MPTATNPLDLFRLDDTVAVVTGASAGLGERMARVMHAVGANVVISARRQERLEALADELGRDRVTPIVADMANEDDRERLIAETIEAHGRVDVLVNNAGITEVIGIEEESLELFRRVLEINTTAVWHLSKLSAPSMIESGGGSIINVASMLGHVGATPVKQANYCASKGAVVNMTRELALQWARRGIRVNALCPGWFPSEMTEPMREERSQDFVRRNTPIPRMGEPHELDGALLLLASPAGTFMTGQSVIVDGGWTAK